MVFFLAALLACEGAVRLRAWLNYGSAATSLRDPMMVRDEAAEHLGAPARLRDQGVPRAPSTSESTPCGFRGDEFSRVTATGGTFRIVCLGASTTFGASHRRTTRRGRAEAGTVAQTDIPKRRIEVINAAVGGYVADDNLKTSPTGSSTRSGPRHPLRGEQRNRPRHAQARDPRGVHARAEPAAGVDGGALSKSSLMFDLAYKNLAILTSSRGGGHADRPGADDLPTRFVGVLDTDAARRSVRRRYRLVLSTFVVKYHRSDAPHKSRTRTSRSTTCRG